MNRRLLLARVLQLEQVASPIVSVVVSAIVVVVFVAVAPSEIPLQLVPFGL